MQRWEYRTLWASYERDAMRVRRLDGVEVTDWTRGPALIETLNQLGSEGWELVHIISGSINSPAELYLKRTAS